MLAFGPSVFKADFRSDKLELIKKLCLPLIFLLAIAPALAFAAPGSMDVDIDGNTQTINYDSTGLQVFDIEADLDFIWFNNGFFIA